MASLLERADQAVSVTKVSRSAKEVFEKLRTGKQDRLVVLKNNAPAAVMLSIRAFEDLMDQLDDLRVAAVARERLRTFDPSKGITHRKMMKRFGTSRKQR